MCVTCGCGDPGKRHGDSRNLTDVDIQSAAQAADLDVHHVVANILAAYNDMHEGDMNAQKSVGLSVIKAVEEQRYTLGLAYGANLPDVGKAADGHRDFAGREALEKAAWSYLKKGGNVGLGHLPGTDNAGTVVESYIYRGPKWVLKATDGTEQTIEPGDWLVGVVWEPEAWALIKSGKINGFSPQGNARRRTPDSEALTQLRR